MRDVAEILNSNAKEFDVRAIQQRFKSLQEKKKRDDRKKQKLKVRYFSFFVVAMIEYQQDLSNKRGTFLEAAGVSQLGLRLMLFACRSTLYRSLIGYCLRVREG